MRYLATAVDTLISRACKEALAPLGLVQKGRSRTWIDDHGWWLVNVEFQASSRRAGCYLNVGDQHLWVVRNHLCFEGMERPLGGTTFVSFDGDEDSFGHSMQGVVDVAVKAIHRRREEHGDGTEALRRLVGGGDDLNAGIAAAMLGDQLTARSRLTGRIHDAFGDLAHSYLDLNAPEARARSAAAITQTRALLGLPAVDGTWW